MIGVTRRIGIHLCSLEDSSLIECILLREEIDIRLAELVEDMRSEIEVETISMIMIGTTIDSSGREVTINN